MFKIKIESCAAPFFNMVTIRALLLSYCLSFSITAYEQPADSLAVFPSPGGASFIYHPKNKSLLLVGGAVIIPDTIKSNVWKWDGNSWSEIKAYGPGSRDFFPAALNTHTEVIYAFGGIGSVNEDRKGDLWSFDREKWTRITSNDIGTRDHHSFVYADHLDAFVLYGGQLSDRKPDTTTWLFKNERFIPLHIPGPGIRYHSAMAYDKQRKKVVLYGGGERPDEHWEFDGAKWTQIITKENPGKKLYHFMVYDDNLKMIILHGGWQNQDWRDPINNLTPVTWAWNGRQWKKLAAERIFPFAMGYDANRKVIVGFGRNDNSSNGDLGLWEFKNGKWAIKANYGKWNTHDHVKRWVKEHPDDMQALAKYADMLQWQTKEFAEAEIAYKKLFAVYPEKISMLIDLSLVLLMQSKVDEAEEYLTKVRNAGLLNREVYIRLAGLLRMENKFRESIRYLEKALEMEPNANEFYMLACNYASISNKDKAFENLNKAAENGFNSKDEYEKSEDLQSLRSDARWTPLLKKLK